MLIEVKLAQRKYLIHVFIYIWEVMHSLQVCPEFIRVTIGFVNLDSPFPSLIMQEDVLGPLNSNAPSLRAVLGLFPSILYQNIIGENSLDFSDVFLWTSDIGLDNESNVQLCNCYQPISSRAEDSRCSPVNGTRLQNRTINQRG